MPGIDASVRDTPKSGFNGAPSPSSSSWGDPTSRNLLTTEREGARERERYVYKYIDIYIYNMYIYIHLCICTAERDLGGIVDNGCKRSCGKDVGNR